MTFKGTHTGELSGIQATGKRVSVIGATLARMVDGKITEERDYGDDLGLLQQLGVVPQLG
jgi:predicted ester cyclase